MLVLKDYQKLLNAITLEDLKILDILSEVEDPGWDFDRNNLQSKYKNVLVTMLQDKLYNVFPIPIRQTDYSDLYKNREYVNQAFRKITWMQNYLLFVNLHEIFAGSEYVQEKKRLWQKYPDDGGREGLVELIAVYNIRDNRFKYQMK